MRTVDLLIREFGNLLFSRSLAERFRQSEKDFTRNRLLPFAKLTLFLLNQVKGELNEELDNFFKALERSVIARRVVSKSAFCKARKKIKHELFIFLNQFVIRFLEENHFMKTWRGRRLFAIDGSTIRLPQKSKLIAEFGGMSQGGRFTPMARVSHIFDVLNKTTHDFQIMNYSWSEQDAVFMHLPSLSVTNAIIIADRGYVSFEIARFILSSGHDFLIRGKIDLKIAKAHIQSGRLESIQQWVPTADAAAKCALNGLSAEPIPVRVITFPGKDGAPVFLFTSLMDSETYAYDEFSSLYHQRWFIEEDYKVKKVHLEMENFTGHSVEAIKQDIHAKVLAQNFAAILITCLDEAVDEYSKHTKHNYTVNMKACLSKLKDCLIFLIYNRNPEGMLHDFIAYIFKDLSPSRPGRSYPRTRAKSAPRKPGYHTTYKRTR